ncbi:M23 family metallopeptidase [Patescibacteria group bacterium]|nr:M23 family metallopeptidase [Patescibacteria group bacterium]
MRHLLFFALLIAFVPTLAHAQTVIDITFPVDGPATFIDDFTQSRSGGRQHNAIDLMADKMIRVLAPTDGRITFAPTTEPSYGYMMTLRGDDGYTYNFIHLNNDTPGTDDGDGGVRYAYADGVRDGTRVTRGQHIAYVGDSGNAESIGSHLHFEIYDGDTAINPYASLIAAEGSLTYNIELERSRATSINDDKDLEIADYPESCTSDSLIRTPDVSTVYYCGSDGGRYVFQNEKTFFSWYEDFDDVEIITTDEMAALPIKGVVTYKPGSYLLKIMSDPKIYTVGKNGALHWVPSSELATELYGEDWAKLVHDLPDGFFPKYRISETVERD